MIHASSLILDDLPCMDNATTRRGEPANHLVFGQDVAILAAIGLMNTAYENILHDEGLTDAQKRRVINILVHTVGIRGMTGGQFVDVKYAAPEPDSTVLKYIHECKTASLFVAAGTTAATLGDATSEELSAIGDYARHLGFGFQVLDDLIDDEDLDKSETSLRDDRMNFAALYGKDKSKLVIEESIRNAIEAGKIFDGKNQKLVAFADIMVRQKLHAVTKI